MRTVKPKFEKIVRNSMKQRVQIAKDVIAQIRAKRLIPTSGTYFYSDQIGNGAPTDAVFDAREMLAEVEECLVCANGALLVQMVDRFDALNMRDSCVTSLSSAANSGSYLQQLFPDSVEIESAFEDYEPGWLKRYPDDRERLIAIMMNIVRNDGEFVIGDIPKQRKAAA